MIHRPVPALFGACALAAMATAAGTPPAYRYGECWWREYAADEAAPLLLHFNAGEPGTVPDGRFGGAWRGGGAALAQDVPLKQPARSVECWFRFEARPAQTACILSVDDDEARLLLRPDGRLELKLRKPHGNPSAKLPAEEQEAIRARPADIVSPDPVPAGQWVHVVAANRPPVVQGAGSPFDAVLMVNGEPVAHYLSEVNNNYPFLGTRHTRVTLGNGAAGDQPFAGAVDEVRLLTEEREFYRLDPLPWREASSALPLQFGAPFFFGERQACYEACAQPPAGVRPVPGVRGDGWLVDPAATRPRLPLPGLNAREGTLEFWLRPDNWDNFTGYWSHTPPPQRELSVARVYARPPGGGDAVLLAETRLPRAHDNERQRPPIDPGHWNHYALVWDTRHLKASLFLNGKWFAAFKLPATDQRESLGPLEVEFGVSDDVLVTHARPPQNVDVGPDVDIEPDAPPLGERARIAVDEIVAYDYPLCEAEVRQAAARCQGALAPLPKCAVGVTYKYSIGKLELRLTPQLPRDQSAAAIRVGVDGLLAPQVANVSTDGFAVVSTTLPQPVAPGTYTIAVDLLDAAGTALAHVDQPWERVAEPWAGCRAGILDRTPPPWTPIRVEGRQLDTCMTRYTLGADGLPAQIVAAGEELLSGPIALLEDGRPLAGRLEEQSPSRDVEATWRARFTGRTCDATLACRLEFDGLLRVELTLTPKGPVAPLAFVVPLKGSRVTHWLANAAGRHDCTTGLAPAADGVFLTSQAKPGSYGFLNQLDLHDRIRGLFWFADNAAGWQQSPAVAAQEVERRGDTVLLRCNLVAATGPLAAPRPIVFGLLPHPARPLPAKHRLYERSEDLSIFDAFKPWPMDPRTHSMKMYPAPDPEVRGSTEPSWDYAERCIPSMKQAKPRGCRTMYLSRYWFSCRAGAYDNWEWRSGPTQQATLTPRFVDYLCWEMDQWIGRGIFDAVYLDECYSCPTRNVEAGHAVVLPDGSIQAGDTLWGFRELMKRWRGIFVQHGREPVLSAHHTGSFIYPGLVFCDATLDGEGRPIVSARSRDFIDAVPLHRLETIQNGALWGVTPFYMVCIWELGLEGRDSNPHKRWAWRMGRDAAAALAHYETAYTYSPREVLGPLWQDVLRWGAADAQVSFHPYWDNARYLQTDGQGSDVLVSCYRQPGRVLLLASNRTAAPRDVRVALDRQALGLPDGCVARNWDSSYPPAAGEDLLPPDALRGEVERAAAQGTARHAVGDLGAELDEALAAEQRPSDAPRLEGNVLVLPTRARDFRLVALEAP